MSDTTHTQPIEIIELDSGGSFYGLVRPVTEAERQQFGISSEETRQMSLLGINHKGIAVVYGKENAQLLAAAPDLLAVCQYYVSVYAVECQTDCDCPYCAFIRRMHAAIHKALDTTPPPTENQ